MKWALLPVAVFLGIALTYYNSAGDARVRSLPPDDSSYPVGFGGFSL
jgi:hypothetical protein